MWLQSSTISFSSVKEKVEKVYKEVGELPMNLDNGENFKKAEKLITFAIECTQFCMKRRSTKNKSAWFNSKI